MKKGKPEVKAICALAFGPDGVLFVADPTTVTVYAIATGDTKPADKGAVEVDNLDMAVADLLGTKPTDITVNDVKVNPASGSVYLAATRKGTGGGAVVLKVGRDKKLTEVSMKDVMYSSVAIPKAAGSKVSGADYIIASYTCTPLVRVPVADLKPGAKVTGTTVAELGNRNKPLDIIVYNKGGKDYALMANSARGVMKIGLDGVDKAEGLTKPVTGGGTAGVKFETITSLEGVVQLDRLDAEHALLVVKGKNNALSLKTIDLP
jgi:hypothetical protein